MTSIARTWREGRTFAKVAALLLLLALAVVAAPVSALAVSESDIVPVYRVTKPGRGDYHYTTDKKTYDSMVERDGWVGDGICMYSVREGTSGCIPVYGLVDNTRNHHQVVGPDYHYWTTSKEEYENWPKDFTDDHAWQALTYPEWYAFPSGTSGMYPVYQFKYKTIDIYYFTSNPTVGEDLKQKAEAGTTNWIYQGTPFYCAKPTNDPAPYETIDKEQPSLYVPEEITLSTHINEPAYSTITYSTDGDPTVESSDPSIASVELSGTSGINVTPHKTGTCTVTVTLTEGYTYFGKSAQIKVTVVDRKPIEYPELNWYLPYTGKSQVGVRGGEGYTITAVGNPKATIDASGNAVATKPGTYRVMCTLDDGYCWKSYANQVLLEPEERSFTIVGDEGDPQPGTDPEFTELPDSQPADEVADTVTTDESIAAINEQLKSGAADLSEVGAGTADSAGNVAWTINIKDLDKTASDVGRKVIGTLVGATKTAHAIGAQSLDDTSITLDFANASSADLESFGQRCIEAMLSGKGRVNALASDNSFSGDLVNRTCQIRIYGSNDTTSDHTFSFVDTHVDDPDVTRVYRLYNQYSGEHLFTTKRNEYNTLGNSGWIREGVAWNAPKNSGTPVYRLYNPNNGDHHYTTDRGEYDRLGSQGWNKESSDFNTAGKDGMPVYRLFNKYATQGTHHYTTKASEYDSLEKSGWTKEGIGWYGLK